MTLNYYFQEKINLVQLKFLHAPYFSSLHTFQFQDLLFTNLCIFNMRSSQQSVFLKETVAKESTYTA